jgi:putative ABC transport system permease protein
MANRRELVIQRQIRLPFKQALKISIRNITLRLGRAAVTAASVFLAIAFLSSVLATKVIQDTLERERKERGRVTAVGDGKSLTGERDDGGARRPEGTRAAAGTTIPRRDRDDAGMAPLTAAALEETDDAEEARRWWLVAMSLLVCLAGITNAMLMSVTERFREIGTMKCLGALDSFVVRLFLIEATLLGVAGSAIGAIAGALLILLVYSIKEGFSLWMRIDWPELLLWMAGSVGVGAAISLIAAIIPAINAARLPPAAALRTDI